jgi:hypothetical protein
MENAWPEMEKIGSTVDANSRMSYPHNRLAFNTNMPALSAHEACQLMVLYDEAESEGTRDDIPSVAGVMIQLNHFSLGHPCTNPRTQKNRHTVACVLSEDQCHVQCPGTISTRVHESSHYQCIS